MYVLQGFIRFPNDSEITKFTNEDNYIVGAAQSVIFTLNVAYEARFRKSTVKNRILGKCIEAQGVFNTILVRFYAFFNRYLISYL